MPEGIQYPEIIDKVYQAKDDSVVLVMREDRAWDGSEKRILELRRKFNTYLAFVETGQFAAQFPDLVGKPISVELRCIQFAPDPKSKLFIDQANAVLARHGLVLKIVVIQVGDPDAPQRERPWWKIW